MPKTLIAETTSLNSSLLAFKPRQVLLFSKTSSAMKPDHKAQLLRSIAGYLDRTGFSKTLKKFRSEAKLEVLLLLEKVAPFYLFCLFLLFEFILLLVLLFRVPER